MSSRIRELVYEAEKKNADRKALSDYLKEAMRIHRRYGSLSLMLEYYMFYEIVSESGNSYVASEKEMIGAFNEMVEKFFFDLPSVEEKAKMAVEILKYRQAIIDRMKVLTAYVDRFVVYEYVLNRVQYRFEDQELLPSDSVFAQDLMEFILAGKDSAAINDNIRYVIGQLPMRMTRSKYYELIKDSISVYQGSDVSSLESFLYMFRTSATFYRDENEDKYFTEFRPVLEELESLDYENLTYELYQIYEEKLRRNAAKLNELSDLYLQLGKLFNAMYTLCISSPYAEEGQIGEKVIKGINALFLEKHEEFWNEQGLASVSDEERLEVLSEGLTEIEGMPEQVYEELDIASSALEEVLHGEHRKLEESGEREAFLALERLFLLSSDSVFADLDREETGEKVSAQMAERAAAELIAECKEFFSGKSRMLRRAVMAGTLEKMPVFFKNAQEIADYIMDSLSQCDDEAEKYASKQLLLDLML